MPSHLRRTLLKKAGRSRPNLLSYKKDIYYLITFTARSSLLFFFYSLSRFHFVNTRYRQRPRTHYISKILKMLIVNQKIASILVYYTCRYKWVGFKSYFVFGSCCFLFFSFLSYLRHISKL